MAALVIKPFFYTIRSSQVKPNRARFWFFREEKGHLVTGYYLRFVIVPFQ